MYSAIARNKRNTWFILAAFILVLAGIGLLAGWLMGNNWWVTAFILIFAAGYAAHESQVFENVTKARAETLSVSSPAEAAAAENHMQSALKSIFAVAEAYPQLQASQNFLQLQGELVDTEDKIQASRRFYNGGVRELNTKIKVFPNTLFVRGLGFHEREFFEVTEPAAIAEPPRVQF